MSTIQNEQTAQMLRDACDADSENLKESKNSVLGINFWAAEMKPPEAQRLQASQSFSSNV